MTKPKSNRLHDLKTVYIDFKIVFNLLKSGYSFDDTDAPAVIHQLEKSLSILKAEIDSIETIESQNC